MLLVDPMNHIFVVDSLSLEFFAGLQRSREAAYNRLISTHSLKNTRSLSNHISWIVACKILEGFIRINDLSLNSCISNKLIYFPY